MKTKITKFNWPTILILLAAFALTGCTAPKPIPDPLAGWKGGTTAYEGNPYDKAITDDYKNYIQTLPPEEKIFVSDVEIRFYEDGTGQHAVKIEIGVNGTWWDHVLIYNKDNKRIKVIKYANGHYRS